MAEHQVAQHHDHMSAMDYAEHERTYRGFLFVSKWGAIAIAVILVLMALFLV